MKQVKIYGISYEPFDDTQEELDLVNSLPTEFVINIVGDFKEDDLHSILQLGYEEFVEQNDISCPIYLNYILKSWNPEWIKIEPNTFITEHTYTINTQSEFVMSRLETFNN
jgi:hypothetical protein